MKYDVAFSYAAEDRDYVEQVAKILDASGVLVFYDRYEQVELWGKDLYEHLQHVFQHQARFTVMFVSKHFARKLWTRHEQRSAQARAVREGGEYILPVRFDDTELPGLSPTMGYLDLRKLSPDALARAILLKLGVAQPQQQAVVKPTLLESVRISVQRFAELLAGHPFSASAIVVLALATIIHVSSRDTSGGEPVSSEAPTAVNGDGSEQSDALHPEAVIAVNGLVGTVQIRSGEPFRYSWRTSGATGCSILSPTGEVGVPLAANDGPIAPDHPWYPAPDRPTQLVLRCIAGDTILADSISVHILANVESHPRAPAQNFPSRSNHGVQSLPISISEHPGSLSLVPEQPIASFPERVSTEAPVAARSVSALSGWIFVDNLEIWLNHHVLLPNACPSPPIAVGNWSFTHTLRCETSGWMVLDLKDAVERGTIRPDHVYCFRLRDHLGNYARLDATDLPGKLAVTHARARRAIAFRLAEWDQHRDITLTHGDDRIGVNIPCQV